MGAFDFTAYQQAAHDAVVQAWQQPEPLDALLDALAGLMAGAERLLAGHPGDRSQIDCGPGCGSCCMVNVSTLLPEGLVISRFLHRQSGAVVELARHRLEELWCAVRGLDDDERLFARRSCAFLDERGYCLIYPVRPLLCRSISSTSAQSCRDALNAKPLGEESVVLMYQYQQDLYETLFSGVADGVEACGLDGRSLQLAGLVRYLLKQPDAEKRWQQGQRLNWQDIY
jgi:hypothetical protein